jgi:hypothetical protein
MRISSAKKILCLLAVSCLLTTSLSPVHAGTWVNVTGNLANMTSHCGNLMCLWAVPGKSTVIADVAYEGLWATTDRGTSWTKMGGTSGDAIDNRGQDLQFDPANANIFYYCGFWGSQGPFKTTDGGVSFVKLGSISMNLGMGIDFSDPLRRTILVGGFNQAQTIYKSTNGGTSFTQIGTSFPVTGNTNFPIVLDSVTYLMGCGSNGIYRTSNGGTSWSQASSIEPDNTALVTSWGTLFWGTGWSAGSGSILKGSANGLTWTKLSAPGNRQSFHPVELPDKKIATVSNTAILISADDGATWKTAAGPIPVLTGGPSVSGLTYNTVDNAFYMSFSDCGGTVRPDAVWRYDTVLATQSSIAIPDRHNQARPDLKTAAGLSNTVEIFDLAGRTINNFALSNGRSLLSGNLYFVKTTGGSIVSRVVVGR